MTGSQVSLLKGHERPRDRQSPHSIPEKGETPVITGNCATCRLLKIDVTKGFVVVNSDWVNKDKGTGKK